MKEGIKMNGLTGRIKTQDSHLIYQDGLLIEKVIEGVSRTEYYYSNPESVEKTRLKTCTEEHGPDSVSTSYFYDDDGNLIQEIESSKKCRANESSFIVKEDLSVKVTTYNLLTSTDGKPRQCHVTTTINGTLTGERVLSPVKDMTCQRYEVALSKAKNIISVSLDVDTSQLDSALAKAERLSEIINRSQLKSLCHNG